MTHSHVRHDSLSGETWLIDMCDMTHWHVGLPCITNDELPNDDFFCETRNIFLGSWYKKNSSFGNSSFVIQGIEQYSSCHKWWITKWWIFLARDTRLMKPNSIPTLGHVLWDIPHSNVWHKCIHTCVFGTRHDGSCHMCEWVMSHSRMSSVTHTNDSCHTYERGMHHTLERHATCVNAFVSHVWMSHVTYEWLIPTGTGGKWGRAPHQTRLVLFHVGCRQENPFPRSLSLALSLPLSLSLAVSRSHVALHLGCRQARLFPSLSSSLCSSLSLSLSRSLSHALKFYSTWDAGKRTLSLSVFLSPFLALSRSLALSRCIARGMQARETLSLPLFLSLSLSLSLPLSRSLSHALTLYCIWDAGRQARLFPSLSLSLFLSLFLSLSLSLSLALSRSQVLFHLGCRQENSFSLCLSFSLPRSLSLSHALTLYCTWDAGKRDSFPLSLSHTLLLSLSLSFSLALSRSHVVLHLGCRQARLFPSLSSSLSSSRSISLSRSLALSHSHIVFHLGCRQESLGNSSAC